MKKVIALWLAFILIRWPLEWLGWIDNIALANFGLILPIAWLLKRLWPELVRNQSKSANWIQFLWLTAMGFQILWYYPPMLLEDPTWAEFTLSGLGRTIGWAPLFFVLCWMVGYIKKWVKNGNS